MKSQFFTLCLLCETMKRLGEILFWGGFALALALYALTAPEGLPWNASTHAALAYLGEVVPPPSLPHPVWGFFVQVLCGPVALSVFAAAVAAGLVGALVGRYFGWRVAVAAIVAWVFLPGVWNRAILGERSVCLAAMLVVAVWILNAVLLGVFRKMQALRAAAQAQGSAAITSHGKKGGRAERVFGWAAMGAAGVFALASLTLHDYALGEAASAFAKGVVAAADGRIIVLNGVCDNQIARETDAAVFIRDDDAYRTNLVKWVRREWPDETNLWVAAQVGVRAFVESATRKFPDRFYLMNGPSTTAEAWEKRWTDFRPFLDSSDPFVPAARKAFAREGNAVANALLDAKGGSEDEKAAWELYRRIYEEVDPGNLAALLNQSEMIRRGFAASGETKKAVQKRLEEFFGRPDNRRRAKEIVRAAGPVRADPGLMEKLAEEAKRRIAAKVAAGETVEAPQELLTLVEWSNEMVTLMDRGETDKAGRIARAILSHPQWQGFVPANGVLGAVAAKEGDYVASEAFFRAATDTTNAVPPVVLNDYANTLMHLGKLDEAEENVRRAIAAADGTFWLGRLTLAEVLEKKALRGAEGTEAEIRSLLKSVLKSAPTHVREKVRRNHRDYIR